VHRLITAAGLAAALVASFGCSSSSSGFCSNGVSCPPEVRLGDDVLTAFCLDLPNATLTPTGVVGRFHPAEGGELIPVQQLSIDGVDVADGYAVQGPPDPEICPGQVEPDLAYAVRDPLLAAALEQRFGGA